jgi:hypothetical protein
MCGGSGGGGNGGRAGGGSPVDENETWTPEKYAKLVGMSTDSRDYNRIVKLSSPAELKKSAEIYKKTNWEKVRAQNAKEQEQAERNIGKAMNAPKTQTAKKKDKYYSPDWA